MKSCQQVYEMMSEVTQASGMQRNFCAEMDMSNYLIETELFPKQVLEVYSRYNLGKPLEAEENKFFSSLRGGSQGDYREKMDSKIDNVIDCINKFPKSKRAIITVPNNSTPSHETDADAKCMRELHLYVEDGKLNGTVLFRAQAAIIFPKNVHCIGSLMTEVAGRLNVKPKVGTLFYCATCLVYDRE